jgi:uncharacterized membrane protein
MRELAGKGCLCLIALIFGVFIGTRFYWVAGFPPLAANAISLLATVLIAWFLLSDSKPKKR